MSHGDAHLMARTLSLPRTSQSCFQFPCRSRGPRREKVSLHNVCARPRQSTYNTNPCHSKQKQTKTNKLTSKEHHRASSIPCQVDPLAAPVIETEQRPAFSFLPSCITIIHTTTTFFLLLLLLLPPAPFAVATAVVNSKVSDTRQVAQRDNRDQEEDDCRRAVREEEAVEHDDAGRRGGWRGGG